MNVQLRATIAGVLLLGAGSVYADDVTANGWGRLPGAPWELSGEAGRVVVVPPRRRDCCAEHLSRYLNEPLSDGSTTLLGQNMAGFELAGLTTGADQRAGPDYLQLSAAPVREVSEPANYLMLLIGLGVLALSTQTKTEAFKM